MSSPTYWTITHEGRDGERHMVNQLDKKSPRLFETEGRANGVLKTSSSLSDLKFLRVERVDLTIISKPEHLAVDNDPPLRDRTVKELAGG